MSNSQELKCLLLILQPSLLRRHQLVNARTVNDQLETALADRLTFDKCFHVVVFLLFSLNRVIFHV